MERKGGLLKKGGILCFVFAIISFVKSITDLFLGNSPLPKDPDVRVGYVIGQMLVPLFCVIVGLYLHKKAKQCQVQTTKGAGYYILLFINIGLVLFYCLVCVMIPIDEKAYYSSISPQLSDPNMIYYLTHDEFSFEIPQGWISIPPDVPSKKAVLVKMTPPSKTPAALIYVQFGRLLLPTIDETAQSLVRAWGGTRIPDETSLDHARALHIQAPYKAPGLNPVEGFIVDQNGRIVMIFGGVEQGQSLGDALETIRTTWKWNSPPSSEDPNSVSATPHSSLQQYI